MDDPKLKNFRRPNNRGHSQGWHADQNTDGMGGVLSYNCPCHGKPQAVSPRLAARIAAFDPGNASAGLKKHKPGSQNRKK